MKTLRISAFGAPSDVVEPAEVDEPRPGPGQVLVAVEAAPINLSDLLLVAGRFGVRPPLPAQLGGEGVGRVVGVGDGVDPARGGERVLVLPLHPNWSERTVVDQTAIVPVGARATNPTGCCSSP